MTGSSIIRATAPAVAGLGSRVQEHGRLRFGIKGTSRGGKEIPKAIKTWRFTSPDKEAIEQLAELYGGTVEKWNDPKANPQNQWQLISTAASIRVFLPPDALNIWYEQWTGAGCQRRCDGVTCMSASHGDDDPFIEVPCLCNQSGKMECKPITRLQVLIPEIRFGGLWRMQTGSWNASEEMPAMERMLQTLQAYGVLEARLSLVEQSIEGGRKQFVMPRLEFAESTQAIIDGISTVVGLPSGSPDRALNPGVSASEVEVRATPEDWVSEALVVTEPEAEAEVVPSDGVGTHVRYAPEDPGRPFTEDDDVVDAVIIEMHPDDGTRTPAKTLPGLKPNHKALHATVGSVAKKMELDADDLRHRLVRTVSKGERESSNDLTDEEISKLLDVLGEVMADERRLELHGLRVRMPKVTP